MFSPPSFYKNLKKGICFILILITSTCLSFEIVAVEVLRIFPDHPQLQYSGRVDFKNPKAPVFSSPGAYIKLNFKGTALSVVFQDEMKSGMPNHYNVIVDDTLEYKITPVKGKNLYPVFSNLKNTIHQIIFVKRTEAVIGKCTFLGFELKGEVLKMKGKPKRKIEFIGNSISCGYGADALDKSPQCKEEGWGQPYHNAYKSFAAQTGRALNAEYHITAVSGIGVYRNWSFKEDARTMPHVYRNMYLEDTSGVSWNPLLFQPDLIVVELGTNDFAIGDSPRPKLDSIKFVNAYLSFVDSLRSWQPLSHVVCLVSPMLGDGYPEKEDSSATLHRRYLKAIARVFNNKGDDKVHCIDVPRIESKGCDAHPTVAQHTEMAKVLVGEIKRIIHW